MQSSFSQHFTRISSFLVYGLTLSVLGGIAGPAGAVIVLDQSYDGVIDRAAAFSGGTIRRAQTFSVTEAGVLAYVDLRVAGDAPTNLQLRAVVAGVPTGTVAATTSGNTLTGDGWVRYSLLSSSLAVGPGDVLAIEPLGAPAGSSWSGSSIPSYPGGAEFFIDTAGGIFNWTESTDGESYFRTWVDIAAIPVEVDSWSRVKGLFER